jgi:uncharacterized protein YdiU (UPF0061 family)
MRVMLLQQLKQQMRSPDVMQVEQCAMTCRVAPSFLRVGHIELFARRHRRNPEGADEKRQLELIVTHALEREFPDQPMPESMAGRAILLMGLVAEQLSTLVANWLRVGFCQVHLLISPHTAPLISPHIAPLISPHTAPLISPHIAPLISPHIAPPLHST